MWKSGVHPYPSSPLGQMQQPFSSQQQHSRRSQALQRGTPLQSNDKSCALRSAIAPVLKTAKSQRSFLIPRNHVPDALDMSFAVS